ncbi:MAG: TldD/PmbA family protein [Silvanigrellaceae bacterium]|nr:TldD/PmbA family protein [Silvanigrellaceae bacterium]
MRQIKIYHDGHWFNMALNNGIEFLASPITSFTQGSFFMQFQNNIRTYSAIEQMNVPTLYENLDKSWRVLLEILLGVGRAAGADFIEFFIEKRNYLNILVENEKVTSTSPVLSLGAGIRVFKGSQDSYVSTNDLTFHGLRSALIKALDIHHLKLHSGSACIPAVILEPLKDYACLKKKEDWSSALTPVKEMAEALLLSNTLQKKQIHHLQSITTSGFYDHQEVLVATSDGVFARDIRLNSSISAQALCADKNHRCSVSKLIGESANPSFFSKLDHALLAAELAEKAGHMLPADYVTSGKYPIVMANQFGGVIFHEACGHLLETTALQSKSTPFANKKGEKIAHENLSAWDQGTWDYGFGSLDMDDEGMPAQQTLLIENGVLKNFISDRTGYLLTGQPRTGSGRRQNYSFPAASRMRNTFIAPGKFSREELFSSIKEGIYCKSLGGGSVNSTGQFNFAVEEAWLIKNGKLARPVKGATLIGEAQEIMQNISMASNDLEIAAGFCGSVSGSIYVTVGQPHIKVDQITVGGR